MTRAPHLAAVGLLLLASSVAVGGSSGRAQPTREAAYQVVSGGSEVSGSTPARPRPLFDDLASRSLFRPAILRDTAPRNEVRVVVPRLANRESRIVTPAPSSPPPAPIAPAVERNVVSALEPDGPLLARIEWCESRDRNETPTAHHPAAGYFQFEPATWTEWAHKAPPASHYDYATQHAAAAAMLAIDGPRPWNSSKTCWSKPPKGTP